MRVHLDALTKLEFEKIKEHIARYTLSAPGREHVSNLQPSSEEGWIKNSLSVLSEMKLLLETDEAPPLDHLPDVRSALHHASIENFILPPDALHAISLLLRTSEKISRYFARRRATIPLLFEAVSPVRVEKVLQYNIDQAIDDEGSVKDSATKEIARIRKERYEQQNLLKRTLEGILKSVVGKDWVQDEIITTREGRMVIPIKVEHKNRVPGFIQSTSASGATVYIEPTETLELNNAIRTLEFEERREIEKLLRALTEQVSAVRDGLQANLEILAMLDFLQAKAKYSIEVIGSAPEVRGDGPCRFVRAYHPILLQRHDRSTVVPLDLETGDDIRTLLITGPNAGGKSVAMKTVGILTILAQSGCHIPASPESRIRIFTDLFVDMGDEQSIENDLSSFSSHLNNLKYIFDHANRDSLVLLDEIGSGTDPLEGSSIAASVLEELSARGCTTIATTHHGSLKAFAFKHPHIENCAMEFDQSTLRPTYRFKSGIPGSSYAIEMAERMSFPGKLLSRAREFKGNQSTALEELIISLESQSAELREKVEALTKEKQTLDASISLYETKLSSVDVEIKAIKNQALLEAQKVIEEAQKEVERLVREIKETSARRETIVQAKQNMADMAVKLKEQTLSSEEEVEPGGEVVPGSFVRIAGTTSEGEVIEFADSSHAIVLVGTMKARVLTKNLRVIPGSKQVHQATPQTLPTEEVGSEVDLRGMYGDEAIESVAKFIDTAVLRGLHRVDIIHGKGTGALRKKVTEYLKTNPAVKSFRLGEWNEGGTGVTVVELE